MSDIRQQRRLARRVGQVEVVERPAVSGFDTLVETGTFTPTYLGATTPGSTTYVTQAGSYTRIGNIVIAFVDLQWSAATGTGNVKIGGLPYAASATVAFAVETSNVTFAAGAPKGLIVSGDDYGRLVTETSNAGATELTIEAAGLLRATIIYPTTG